MFASVHGRENVGRTAPGRLPVTRLDGLSAEVAVDAADDGGVSGVGAAMRLGVERVEGGVADARGDACGKAAHFAVERLVVERGD
jgi:hypothetical protein